MHHLQQLVLVARRLVRLLGHLGLEARQALERGRSSGPCCCLNWSDVTSNPFTAPTAAIWVSTPYDGCPSRLCTSSAVTGVAVLSTGATATLPAAGLIAGGRTRSDPLPLCSCAKSCTPPCLMISPPSTDQ